MGLEKVTPEESAVRSRKIGSEAAGAVSVAFCEVLSQEKKSQQKLSRQMGNRNSFIQIKSELPQRG